MIWSQMLLHLVQIPNNYVAIFVMFFFLRRSQSILVCRQRRPFRGKSYHWPGSYNHRMGCRWVIIHYVFLLSFQMYFSSFAELTIHLASLRTKICTFCSCPWRMLKLLGCLNVMCWFLPSLLCPDQDKVSGSSQNSSFKDDIKSSHCFSQPRFFRKEMGYGSCRIEKHCKST